MRVWHERTGVSVGPQMAVELGRVADSFPLQMRMPFGG